MNIVGCGEEILNQSTPIMRATEIRKDISLEELRRAAKAERDSGMCRRLLGICHLIETGNRREAQRISCLTVNCFCIWIKRFNVGGIGGLRRKRPSRRWSKIDSKIEQELQEKVVEGPLETEGLARYRLVDLQDFLQEKYNLKMSLSGIWRKLQRLNLTWKTSRQRHPQSDEDVQEAFKKTL